MPDDRDMQAWLCPRGHVMGLLRWVDGVRSLYLYRQAIDLEKSSDEEIASVDVMAVVEWYILDVACSVCGERRSLAPGETVLRRWEEIAEDYRRKLEEREKK